MGSISIVCLVLDISVYINSNVFCKLIFFSIRSIFLWNLFVVSFNLFSILSSLFYSVFEYILVFSKVCGENCLMFHLLGLTCLWLFMVVFVGVSLFVVLVCILYSQ